MMMDSLSKLKIDTNVPLPAHGAPKLALRRYPELFALRPGDSFFVPEKQSHEVSPYVAYAVREGEKVEGIRKNYTTRKVEEKGVVGVRVWRVD